MCSYCAIIPVALGDANVQQKAFKGWYDDDDVMMVKLVKTKTYFKH